MMRPLPMASMQARRNPFAAIPGLVACFDLRDSSRYTPVVSKVDTWKDFSGAGRDFQQTTDARRAVLVAADGTFASGVNYLSVAAGQLMDSVSAFPAFPTGCSFGMGIAGTPTQNGVMLESGSGTDTEAIAFHIQANPRYSAFYQRPTNANFHQYANATPPTKSRFIATYDPTTPAVRSYIDNVVGTSISAGASAGTIQSRTWRLFARTGLVAPSTAKVCAFAVYDHVLTTNERAALDAILLGYVGV